LRSRNCAGAEEFQGPFQSRLRLLSQGDHQRALEHCDHAIEFEPDLAIAHVNRGHTLTALY
jgi:hypothetical protein